VKVVDDGLVSIPTPAAIEKRDEESEGVDKFEETPGIALLFVVRGYGEASASPGTPSSPGPEQGSPL